MSEGIWCLVSHLRPRRCSRPALRAGLRAASSSRAWSETARAASGASTSRTWTHGCTTRSARLCPKTSGPGGPLPGHEQAPSAAPPRRAGRDRPLRPRQPAHRTQRPLRARDGVVGAATRRCLVVDDIGHSLAFHGFTEAVAPSFRLTARHADGGEFWGVVVKGVRGADPPAGFVGPRPRMTRSRDPHSPIPRPDLRAAGHLGPLEAQPTDGSGSSRRSPGSSRRGRAADVSSTWGPGAESRR